MNTGKGCVVQLRGGDFSDVEIRNHRESEWKEEEYFCVGSDCKGHESHPSLSAKTRKPSREEHKIALASESQGMHCCNLHGHTCDFSCF